MMPRSDLPGDLLPFASTNPRRLFYWCHTTSRQPFETGIQRVTRQLGRSLGGHGFDVVPVGRDESSGLVEIIGRGAAAFEAALATSGSRPLLFIPEITADLVAQGMDPTCMARAYGLRPMSVVHDLIPMTLHEHYAAETVVMFTAYYESFARTDGVLATTRGVADELRRFLEGRALPVPPITVVPLPAQLGRTARVIDVAAARGAREPLRLVTVVSWERRKNLPRLLRALARAQRDAPIALTLVGRRGLDLAYDAEVEALLGTARDVTVTGALPDDALVQLIAASHATIYPSFEEGFGLPVGESLWLGRPCVCHNASSLAEIAPGGGTLMIDMLDKDGIVGAMVSLATQPALLARLGEEAIRRPLLSWHDYAGLVGTSLDRLGSEAGAASPD